MTNLGPLTTTFIPPPSCTSSFAHVYITTDPGGTAAFGGPVSPDGCFPTNYQNPLSNYYSPGICPLGYTAACSSLNSLGSLTETAVTCCPGFGFSYWCVGTNQGSPVSWVTTYHGCGSGFTTMSTVATIASNGDTFVFTWGQGDLNAIGVQVRFQSVENVVAQWNRIH
jgi:hypothetical protein